MSWKWLAPPDHLHYFRPDSLKRAIERIGFKIQSIGFTSYDYEVEEMIQLGIPRDEASTLLAEGLGDQIQIIAKIN